MGISKRKSEKLQSEIQKWLNQLQLLNQNQNNLANELFEQVEILLKESSDGKAEIANIIEDQIFDFLEKETDLLTLIETIGGIELEIVEVNPILSEISDEQKILEAIIVSTKNLVKSTLDVKKTMHENIRNEIIEIVKACKSKRDQISKLIHEVNLKLSSNINKIGFL